MAERLVYSFDHGIGCNGTVGRKAANFEGEQRKNYRFGVPSCEVLSAS